MKDIALFLALTGATSAAARPTAGEITVCNSGLGFKAAISSEVQSFLSGMDAPDEEKLLDRLFPPIPGEDAFQFAKGSDQYYLTDGDGSDLRATGADFQRVQFSGTVENGTTEHKGLSILVEHRGIPKGADGKPLAGWQNRFAALLRKRLVRAEKYRGLALLRAAAHNTAAVWSAATNPDKDLRAAAKRTRTACGRMPSLLVIGSEASDLRKDAYEESTRANHGTANHAGFSLAQLAEYVGAGEALIEEGTVQLKKGGAKTSALALECFSYFAEESPMIDDASMTKRIWTPNESGEMWTVHVEEQVTGSIITVWHTSRLLIPDATGIEMLTVAAA